MTKPDHGIKAILFDLDGVLINGAPLHREALIHALHDFGADILEREILTFEGLTTIDKLAELSKAGRVLARDHEAINELKQKYMLELIEKKCEPVKSISEAVIFADELMPCAVVTNCSRDAAHLMLEKADLKRHMCHIITNADVPAHQAKPSPRPYLEGAWKFGLTPKQCLAFDDTDRGIKSAMEAGCRFHRIKKFGDLTKEIIHAKLESLRIRL